MIKDILISTLITLVVASTTGAIALYGFEASFWKTFAVATFSQLLLFYIWNSLVQIFVKIRLEQEQTKQYEIFEEQGRDVNCAYCNHSNFIPILLNSDNKFICDNCGEENSVYIDITIARKTDIISTDKSSKEEISEATQTR